MPIEPLWYRRVLGQFPTGVVIVAATDDDEGTPVGMSVGSFTSVSLDPPLVAFLPARSSTSWPRIAPANRFCINVLAGEQEALCRAFAVSGADKFKDVTWRPSPLGNPIIEGSLAWIDCELERVDPAGDHYIVIGRVHELEVENPSAPLIFFQGGYGRFDAGPLAAAARGDLAEPLRLADLARPELDALANDLDVECVATALVGDEIVLLASAGPLEGRTAATLIGRRIPARPPLGALWMAYEATSAPAPGTRTTTSTPSGWTRSASRATSSPRSIRCSTTGWSTRRCSTRAGASRSCSTCRTRPRRASTSSSAS